MTTIKGTRGFDQVWNKAREDGTPQSSRVSYGELQEAMGALKASGNKISRAEARHAASTFAQDPVLTAPAKKEALAFLQTVGAGRPIDATTVEAMKADFSLRATAPFKSLDVPGRVVKNPLDLPDAVAKAAAQTTQPPDDLEWANVEVKKATLAGQTVYIVHHSELDNDMDLEKVQVFSAAGKPLANGGLWDAMAGFSWD